MYYRSQLLLLLIFLSVKTGYSQNCSALGQNPNTSFPVCGTTTFHQSNVPICGGKTVPSQCPGTIFTDKNPYWYQFTCFESGTLGFSIRPDILADDYDWQLFDITGRNPNDVFTDVSLFVACNWSGESGVTGASSAGASLVVCDNLGRPLFSSMPQLIKGHTYILLVSHFTDSQSGYSLSFGGGTASITDTTVAKIKNATISCDGKTIYIKLNKKMKCGSLAANGSNFSIANSNVTITSAIGFGCTNGFDMDSVILNLNNGLPNGNYLITAQGLRDNCDAFMLAADFNLQVVAPPPPQPDSITTVGCAPTEIQLVLAQSILCNTIAADGSDFSITGNSNVSIASASGVACNNGMTKLVNIKLSSPIKKGGIYQLSVIADAAGNTLADACGQQVQPNSTLDFSVTDTVSATFQYTVKSSCTADTISFIHNGNNNVNTWRWYFDDIQKSTLQDPKQIYTSIGEKQISLFVSNGVCTDSIAQTIALNFRPDAQFEINEFICPNEKIIIRNNSTGNINSWSWNFGNGQTSSLKDPAAPVYPQTDAIITYPVTLVAGNGNGCSDTLIKHIKTVSNCYIAVPSAFTPNNDGLNDYLYPLNAYKADGLSFRVYNRLGQEVFYTTDWTRKWDGRFKGQPQNTGTFIWILIYTDKDTGKKFELKGSTVLIR